MSEDSEKTWSAFGPFPEGPETFMGAGLDRKPRTQLGLGGFRES